MTPRQCEIAAESYTACLLAQAGYDVLVQYGANQPDYDLVAVKEKRMLPISVKGSQDGGWMLAVRYKEKGVTYHEAIDRWLAAQRDDVVFVFVQFSGVLVGGVPRAYVARPIAIAEQLKSQRNGQGYGSLQEDRLRHNPKSSFSERLPAIEPAQRPGLWLIAGRPTSSQPQVLILRAASCNLEFFGSAH